MGDREALSSGEFSAEGGSTSRNPDGGGHAGRGWSRRGFLRAGGLAGAGFACGWERLSWAVAENPVPGGRLAGLAPFADESAGPAGMLIGEELDGRLFTDLSRVADGRLITPKAEFFIRSAASRLLPDPAGWTVRIGGLVEREAQVGMDRLRSAAKPMGTHLMECAGNVALTRFGLMSVAEWTGVSVADVLGEAKRKAGAAWVEISGFDEYAGKSRTSIPGASWVFPQEDLKGAFLAMGMNGKPLGQDHGAPVRLVIPGWYGCACIKWVNRIAFVDEGAEASSQMQEYAVRTLQGTRPRMAREYQPATVDAAALPVRVEKWIVGGKIRYRVIGIVWGGSHPVEGLAIRFNPSEPFTPVLGFRQEKTDPWTVWTYMWSPRDPGDYQIRMAITSPGVRARKLEMGLYDRAVHIAR